MTRGNLEAISRVDIWSPYRQIMELSYRHAVLPWPLSS